MKTLHEIYELKKLKEKLVVVESKIMLSEAFDKKVMKRAAAIGKGLNSIDFSGLASLVQVRKNCLADMTQKLSKEKSFISKILKIEGENPLKLSEAFFESIDDFFELFTDYVEGLSVGENTDLTVKQIMVDSIKNPDTEKVKKLSKKTKSQLDIETPDDQKELKDVEKYKKKIDNTVLNFIKKGLTTEPNWIKKYNLNIKQLIDEMLNLKFSGLQNIKKSTRDSFDNTVKVLGSSTNVDNASQKPNIDSIVKQIQNLSNDDKNKIKQALSGSNTET